MQLFTFPYFFLCFITSSGPFQAVFGPECRRGPCFRPISGRFRAGVLAGFMVPARFRPFSGRSAGGVYASGPYQAVSGPECRRGSWLRPISGHFRAGVSVGSMLPARFRPFSGRSVGTVHASGPFQAISGPEWTVLGGDVCWPLEGWVMGAVRRPVKDRTDGKYQRRRVYSGSAMRGRIPWRWARAMP